MFSKKLEEPLKKLTRLKDNLKDLTEEEAYTLTELMLEGKLPEIRVAVFLTSMRIKGETPEELYGILRAIKKRCRNVDKKEKALDIALNYDGKEKTVYILPSAIYFCKKLGVEFTYHYAERVPTKEGVTLYDVLKALRMDKEIDIINQKDFIPELYSLMPLRRELGFRTFINTVEKLINPFNANKIITSVFHKPYFEKVSELLERLGYENYMIVKGVEGGIEPLPDRPTFFKLKGKEIEKVSPEDLNIRLPENIETDNVLEHSVRINKEIIEGKRRDEFFNWAVYTASFLLLAYGKVKSLEEGKELLLYNI